MEVIVELAMSEDLTLEHGCLQNSRIERSKPGYPLNNVSWSQPLSLELTLLLTEPKVLMRPFLNYSRGEGRQTLIGSC